MAEDSDLERTEEPSARRLQEARDRGQVARSHELVTFAVVAGGVGGVIVTGSSMLDTLKQVMVRNLTFDHQTLADTKQMMLHMSKGFTDALMVVLPVMGVAAVSAFVAAIVLSGWLFSLEPLMPNFGKLNPMTGIGRIFSVRSLVEATKAILKASLVGGVAAMTIWHERTQVVQLVVLSPLTGFAAAWELIRFTITMVVGSLLIIVLIDVPYQLWDYRRNLRMTKQEVRQEHKESEGDPQVKAKIRQMQMQAARRRMMTEIPKANVVVTNPTHYAVALRYDEKKMRAPIVVAKGSYLLAERIIEIGKEHKIPILRTPPLARALYHHAELGQDIPNALYTAVAEVLAYLYQLNHWRRFGGFQPELAKELPVPDELDPGGEA